MKAAATTAFEERRIPPVNQSDRCDFLWALLPSRQAWQEQKHDHTSLCGLVRQFQHYPMCWRGVNCKATADQVIRSVELWEGGN